MSARILVNDDEAGTIHTLKRLQEREGYTALDPRAVATFAWAGVARCATAIRGGDPLALGAERGRRRRPHACRRADWLPVPGRLGVVDAHLSYNLDTMVHSA